jgi:hypothetical protein
MIRHLPPVGSSVFSVDQITIFEEETMISIEFVPPLGRLKSYFAPAKDRSVLQRLFWRDGPSFDPPLRVTGFDALRNAFDIKPWWGFFCGVSGVDVQRDVPNRELRKLASDIADHIELRDESYRRRTDSETLAELYDLERMLHGFAMAGYDLVLGPIEDD